MAGQTPPDDVCACASRLVNLIQVLAFNEPELLKDVEEKVWIVVTLGRRKHLAATLESLDAQELAMVGIFLEQFKRGDPGAATAQ